MSAVNDRYRVPRSRAAVTHQGLRQDILEALEPILFDSAMNGYAARATFEERFAAAVNRRFATAVHSGSIALYIGRCAPPGIGGAGHRARRRGGDGRQFRRLDHRCNHPLRRRAGAL